MNPEIIQAQMDIVNAEMAFLTAQQAMQAAQVKVVSSYAALRIAQGKPAPSNLPMADQLAARLSDLQTKLVTANAAALNAEPPQAQPALAPSIAAS